MTFISVNTSHLVAMLQQKNHQGYSLLYDQYAGSVLGILSRIVIDGHIAEDLLQVVFVKVWSSIDSFDTSKGTFFTWLSNIARNTALDHLRSKQHKTHKLQSGTEVQESLLQSFQTVNVESIGLKNLVGVLKPQYRQVIELIYFLGYTQEEASKFLDMPLGTVKSRTRTALQILREYYVKG